MMNLNTMNDADLIQETQDLVREERNLLTSVLHHLREISRRRLYSSMGYKSLFDFTSRHLGYPEDQAYRRISAMMCLKELPEIEDKIQSGEISLTHINLAQTLFRQEKKMDKELSHDQKLSVFNQIAKKSVRAAEKITLSLSSAPESAKPDRVNAVSDNLVEMKFTASNELLTKVEQLKGMLAHQHPNINLGELFEKLCDLGLTEWDPTKSATPRKRRISCKTSRAEKNVNVPSSQAQVEGEVLTAAPTTRRVNRQPSFAQVKRDAFARAGNQCENCGSRHALEVDHFIPQAKGGTSEPENLRVLCRSCNQHAAIKEFGLRQMDQFIN